jgi:hypothetical protein
MRVRAFACELVCLAGVVVVVVVVVAGVVVVVVVVVVDSLSPLTPPPPPLTPPQPSRGAHVTSLSAMCCAVAGASHIAVMRECVCKVLS